jgi:hypothetical protein
MIDPRMQMLAALSGQPGQMPGFIPTSSHPPQFGAAGSSDFGTTPADGAMNGLFGVPPAALTRMAGDVVPLPIQPGPAAGRPPLAEVVQGQKAVRAGDPAVINHPGRDDWYNRTKLRLEMPMPGR